MGGTISQEVALGATRARQHPDARRHLGLGRELVEGPGGDAVRPQRRPHPEQIVDNFLVLNLSEGTAGGRARRMSAPASGCARLPTAAADGLMCQAVASNHHDARDRLGALSMPVHVIGAEQDILVPAWKSKQLAE